MPPDLALSERIAMLESESAIRRLVARYCYCVDDHDVGSLATLFTADTWYHSKDGSFDVRGRDDLRRYFDERLDLLGPTNHFTHDHVIDWDDVDPDIASGLVNSHAEVIRDGAPMLVSLRYYDRYHRKEGAWRFAERELSIMYYCPVEDYPAMWRSTRRKRVAEPHGEADHPEALWGKFR